MLIIEYFSVQGTKMIPIGSKRDETSRVRYNPELLTESRSALIHSASNVAANKPQKFFKTWAEVVRRGRGAESISGKLRHGSPGGSSPSASQWGVAPQHLDRAVFSAPSNRLVLYKFHNKFGVRPRNSWSLRYLDSLYCVPQRHSFYGGRQCSEHKCRSAYHDDRHFRARLSVVCKRHLWEILLSNIAGIYGLHCADRG